MRNLFKKGIFLFFVLMLVLLCTAVTVIQFQKLQKQEQTIKGQKEAEVSLKNHENGLKKKIQDLEEEVIKITSQAESTKRNAAQKMQAMIGEQQQRMKNLQDGIAGFEKEKIVLIRQIAKAKDEKKEIIKERDQLAKQQSKGFLKEQEVLQKENQRQKKEEQEQQLRLAKASGEKEINQLKEKISGLNQGNAKLSSGLKLVNAQLKELDKVKKELQDSGKKNNTLSLESEKLKKENQELKNNFSSLQQLNNELQKKSSELYLRSKDAEQIPVFQRTIEGLSAERAVLDQRIKDLEQQLEVVNKTKAGQLRDVAWAYMKIKDFDSAIDFYNQSLSLDPRSAEANYRLGLLYEHSQGNVNKAIFHLKRYLSLEPKAKNRKEVEYLIEMLVSNPPNKWSKPW